MTPLSLALVLLLSGTALSWVLTAGLRRYALARAVLDVPNHRSSHSVPTPRGGGLAIALVALAGLALAAALGWVAPRLALALGAGGALVAAVGWVDDHRPLPARARFAIHAAAAAWALWWLGGMPALTLGHGTLRLGIAGAVIALTGIVWVVNLYNFMDGIDGLAGGEAVTAGVAGGALLLWAGHPGMALAALLLATAGSGFLAWNWSPARIFMGDVGSCFLGFSFAVLAVASQNAGAVPLIAWVVLLGVFVVDATFTLVRRALRREAWYDAHRQHAYQRMVDAGWSHARVSGSVMAVNVVLAGLAAVIARVPSLAALAFAAAMLLLVGLYVAVERLRPM
jgi:Fuc2NAc and GlcNAc transferase